MPTTNLENIKNFALPLPLFPLFDDFTVHCLVNITIPNQAVMVMLPTQNKKYLSTKQDNNLVSCLHIGWPEAKVPRFGIEHASMICHLAESGAIGSRNMAPDTLVVRIF